MWAQTAQITGRVSDPSDLSIAGASVTIRNTETGVTREIQTNLEGYFVAPLLPRGIYEIKVQQSGFKPVLHSNITLDEGYVLRVDFALEVGDVKQTVEVTGTAPVLERETAAMSAVIANEKIMQLPLLNRNVFDLTALVPTVRPLAGFSGLPVSSGANNSRISISGGSYSSNNYQIDGIAAENMATGIISVFLSVDATQEFRVITRNPSAEYGRLGGGAILITSKSGTNEFHGSAYEYFRNTVLNANDFFSNAANRKRADTKLNQWGATLGGPIFRQKTFFFFNYEGFEQRVAANTTRSLPTAAQRSGDFGATLDTGGRQVMIYDPLTTRPNGSGGYIRDLFPSNVIPGNRISAASQAMLSYLPMPNQPGVPGTAANNFYGQGSSPTSKRIYGIKVDHNINSMRRISARYTHDSTFYTGGPNYYNTAAELAQYNANLYRNSAVLAYTDALRPHLLLELRGGLNSYGPGTTLWSGGFDITKLGMPASLKSQMQSLQFPSISVADITGFGASSAPFRQGNYQHTYGGSLTQIMGAHTIKYGGEFRLYQQNSSQLTNLPLSLSFTRGFTQGPDPNTSGTNVGYGFASFLLGYPSGGTGSISATKANTLKYLAFFVQDDWKVTPKLTLNLGLRWDHEGAFTDRFNAMTNFDPKMQLTAGGMALTGGLLYPGKDGVPRGVTDTSMRNLGPRFGFAYQIRRKTVMRGGYGLFYLPTTGMVVTVPRYGFDQTTSLVATNSAIQGGFYPVASLSNPFPNGLLQALGAAGGPSAGVSNSVSATGRWLRPGISQQFGFSIEQELPWNAMVDFGYVANRGAHLETNRSYHYLPFATAEQYTVAQLQASVPYPYCSLAQQGTVCNPTTSYANMLSNYPQYNSMTVLDNWGDSIYHALTVRFERRFGANLTALVGYTFSKLLDNTAGNGTNVVGADGGSNSPQDWDHLQLERAVSSMNVPHRLVTTVLYALPFGKGGSRLNRALLGGWQVNGILTLQSGDPIAVTTSVGGQPFAGARPNWIGDPKPANQTFNNWLNPAAFTPAPSRTPGNAPRNLPYTRTDSLMNLDTSLLKDIPVTERFRLQVRAEATNATNTPTFGQPGTGLGSTTFGVITSTASLPRNVQFGLKFLF